MADRAVSTAVSYALILGIVVLLLTGVTTGFAPLVMSQQADATHTTFEVIGNDVAGDIASADRLAVSAGPNGTVVLRTRLPDRVGGSRYYVDIAEQNKTTDEQLYEITLTSVDHETSATVGLRTQTAIDTDEIDRLDGGSLEIALKHGTLVVNNA
jgi:hypothetical protein